MEATYAYSSEVHFTESGTIRTENTGRAQMTTSQGHCATVNKATRGLCAERPLSDPLLNDAMITWNLSRTPSVRTTSSLILSSDDSSDLFFLQSRFLIDSTSRNFQSWRLLET